MNMTNPMLPLMGLLATGWLHACAPGILPPDVVHLPGRALIALLEQAAIQCMAPGLETGQGSAGTQVDIQHLAATPVGMKVVARAELREVDGRRLVFKVEARDEHESIAGGSHERFIIGSMEKFLARAAAKGKA